MLVESWESPVQNSSGGNLPHELKINTETTKALINKTSNTHLHTVVPFLKILIFSALYLPTSTKWDEFHRTRPTSTQVLDFAIPQRAKVSLPETEPEFISTL